MTTIIEEYTDKGSIRASRKVILAASLGAALEWYDFFVFGSLAAIIAKNFYSNLNGTSAFIFALLTFAAGFIVRPMGALVFGKLGDQTGRKRTFLLTILIMGVATVLIGLLPTYASIGITAPIALIILRMLQGFSLGGEYGAAATYVAEHAPKGKRGFYTSWIQTTSTVGLLLSLVIVTLVRDVTGPAFDDWGWRIPFIFSGLLVVISIYIRRSMGESPAFQRIKDKGEISRAPLSEAFCRWENLKLVLGGLLGLLAGQAVVWFTALFYSLFFLTETLKVDPNTANILVAVALTISTPLYIVFGMLSDRVGRKPIILGGSILSALLLMPIFHGLAIYANPALLAARENAPVVVEMTASDCSLQFNPTGTARFTGPCDVAKKVLASAAVNYATRDVAAGQPARILVGQVAVAAPDLTNLPPTQAKAVEDAFKTQVVATLRQVGYPQKADPAGVNKMMIVILLVLLMTLGAMTLAPISAALVEMFPTRIRYSAMSLPYHIGNGYFGGLLPAICFAIVAYTGDIFSGLWYPVIVAAASAVIGLLFVSGSKHPEVDD